MILSRLLHALDIDKRDIVLDMASDIIDDPFSLLVAVILSQNTSDRNSWRAFRRLSSKMGTTLEAISSTPEHEIEEAIRPAGLHRVKAKKLRALAEAVSTNYHGRLDSLLSKPTAEAREGLLSLPAVGPKTADILLLFYAKRRVFPIDTHISRISKRLGLVGEEAGYEEIRRRLEGIFDPDDYLIAHKVLIKFGRRYCRARNPLCEECPLRDICKWRAGGGGRTIN